MVNDKPLPSGSRFNATADFGHVLLEIYCAREEDAGVYVYKAENAFGEARTSASLRVEAGVESGNTLHPSGARGLKSVEEVEAKANAPKESGVNMDLPKDAEEEVSAPLHPHFPEPLSREVTFSAESGEPLTLKCRVEPRRDPNLSVQWYRNGLPLEAGSRAMTTLDFGRVELKLADLKAEDAGVYTCKAVNAAGDAATFSKVTLSNVATSGVEGSTLHPRGEAGLQALAEAEKNRAELSIEGLADAEESPEPSEAPHFLEPFIDVTAPEGGSVYCQATLLPKNDGSMKVEWQKEGELLKEGVRLRTVNLFGLAILEIRGIKESEFGSYVCQATNAAGSATSEFTIAKSDDGLSNRVPKFTSQLKEEMILKEGESAHLQCSYVPTDDADLSVSWTREGAPIEDSYRLKSVSDFGFAMLDISAADTRDSGQYVCTISNKYHVNF